MNPTSAARRRRPAAVLAALCALALAPAAEAVTYYVSSSSGNDGNAGTSPGSPFRTIARVNALNLGPGDQVRFFCGEVWRTERLIVTDSGAAGQPIIFTSHPLACANRPVFSGTQPIVGWVPEGDDVYSANLDTGGNAGRFPGGINQLFENGERLPYGRWPNLGTANGGYSTIDGHGGSTITDHQLPTTPNWTGAYVQHKGEIWYLRRRQVTADGGTTLTLNAPAVCTGGCVGWGFFLNHHRATLDADGEWYYDAGQNRVYVVSTSGPPADGAIEGSVVGTLPSNDDQSGIVLGVGSPNGDVARVVVDNLEVRGWAVNGIQMARLLADDDNEFITLRNNLVADVGRAGIRLTSFVFDAAPAPDSLRGGRNGLVQNNVVEGANLVGIEMYSTDTVVERNTIRDVGRLANLVDEGLGCPLANDVCAIWGNGIMLLVDDESLSGNGNTIRLNDFERIAWTGIDVLGPFNLIERNVVVQASSTIAEGAGIRTFGGNSFAVTKAHDITISENVVHSSTGNVDGVPPPRDHLWGYGINVSHFTDDVAVVGNTVTGCTAYGVNFAFSRGTTTDNTLWNNSIGPSGAHHFRFIDGVTRASFLRNVVYARVPNRAVMSVDVLANLLASDDNYYFNPYDVRLVRAGEISNIAMTLPNWQATSGLDADSRQAWFSLSAGAPDVSVLFVNETESPVVVPLAQPHLDLDQNVVSGSFTLDPFASRILIAPDAILFADGFESGDTSAWSATVGE